ncbi:MAG TPA: carboxymuconolactone decarboxylase family protein [Candidatus Dormibacteraeota bacterium]|nr:carboxymuconolactone decarboxylase family protein [Candidatus Dormibacteraeota bacterium]
MTARVPYVKDDPVFARVEAMGRPVLNLYRVLANQPAALDAFLDMSAYVRGRSSLDPKLREAVILTTARELGSAYEVAHHSAGVELDELDERGRCAVDYARAAARTRTCDDVTFERLKEHFSTAEIVDLVVTVGWYHLCAVILGSLAVELERG